LTLGDTLAAADRPDEAERHPPSSGDNSDEQVIGLVTHRMVLAAWSGA